MTWGGEVKLRAKLEDALEEYYTVPCVAIVLGGGVGTFDNVYEMLQRDNPVLVVKESRGCAMAVAEFYEAHCAAVQKLEGRQTLTEDELKEMVSKIEIPEQKMMSSEKARRAILAHVGAMFPQFSDAHSIPIQAREKLGVIAETLQKFINQEPPLIYVYSDSSKPFEQARNSASRAQLARNSRHSRRNSPTPTILEQAILKSIVASHKHTLKREEDKRRKKERMEKRLESLVAADRLHITARGVSRATALPPAAALRRRV